jgi:hypothetical protein
VLPYRLDFTASSGALLGLLCALLFASLLQSFVHVTWLQVRRTACASAVVAHMRDKAMAHFFGWWVIIRLLLCTQVGGWDHVPRTIQQKAENATCPHGPFALLATLNALCAVPVVPVVDSAPPHATPLRPVPAAQFAITAGGAALFSIYLVFDIQLLMGSGAVALSPDEYVYG